MSKLDGEFRYQIAIEQQLAKITTPWLPNFRN
jgi:hypothetical protein